MQRPGWRVARNEFKPDVEEMNATDFEANPEEIEAIPEHW